MTTEDPKTAGEPWPTEWYAKTWKTLLYDGSPTLLTERELHAFYVAVPQGKEAMCRALGVSKLSYRKADRALQLLRKAKLIHYEGRVWKHTGRNGSST